MYYKKISITLLIINLILYFFAPNEYNMILCFISMILFFINVFVLFKNVHISKIDYFNILFAISFFSCNFVYPCFVFPIDEYYFNIFAFISAKETITKATLLASLGYSAYVTGYLSFRKRKLKNRYIEQCEYSISITGSLLLTIVNLVLLILFLSTASSAFYRGEFNSLKGVSVYISIMYKSTLFLITILSFYANRNKIEGKTFSFIRNLNLFVLVGCLIYMILQLRSGERGVIIQFLFLMFLMYEIYVRRISKYIFFSTIIIGALAMSYIAQNRGSSNFLENRTFAVVGESYPLIDIAMDFIVNNVTLLESLNYVDSNGFTYGTSLLGPVLQTVPFSQSVLLPVFNIDLTTVSSAQLMTNYIFDNIDTEATYGLGTNLNADLYIVGGSAYLLLVMMLFGYIIALLSYKTFEKGDIISIIIYSSFFVLAIYLPRSSLFFTMQPIVWSYLIFKIVAKKIISNG